MNYRIYKKEDFTVSKWTGGTTVQLGIFPEDSVYVERNFVWRLSTAVCAQEETVFTKLPDYDRVLMVLSGSTVLAHQNVRSAKLQELEQDRFDGAYITKSFGKVTDYNLMIAKGNQGFLDAVPLSEDSQVLECKAFPEYEHQTVALYCRDGYAAVTLQGETMMLKAGEQLIAEFEQDESVNLAVMGEGTLIRAQIFFHYREEEMRPSVIPPEKATFDDFRACVYLANVQFRGAKYIFRKLKHQWFDEELTTAINKLEKLYIPFFIAVLGCCGIAIAGHETWSTGMMAAGLAAWLLIDIFIVSPLLYFAVVPKPVRKHIKDIQNLTPYEQAVYEKQKGSNEALDRLLRKYEHSGRITYDKDGNAVEKP